MTMREALDHAMRRDDPDAAMAALNERGVAVTDEDTMSKAVHDVYCGIVADHEHPNEEDRSFAKKLMEALRRHAPN